MVLQKLGYQTETQRILLKKYGHHSKIWFVPTYLESNIYVHPLQEIVLRDWTKRHQFALNGLLQIIEINVSRQVSSSRVNQWIVELVLPERLQ